MSTHVLVWPMLERSEELSEVLIYSHLVATGCLFLLIVGLAVAMRLQTLTVTRSAEFRDAVRTAVEARQAELERKMAAVEASWEDSYKKIRRAESRAAKTEDWANRKAGEVELPGGMESAGAPVMASGFPASGVPRGPSGDDRAAERAALTARLNTR